MLPAVRKNIAEIEIPNKHLNNARETNLFALNHYALGISGKLCGVDGDVNLGEKRAFLTLFPYFGGEHLPLLKQSAVNGDSVYLMCRRFCKFTNENTIVSAKLFARLFKLAGADNIVNIYEIAFMEKTATMLGLRPTFLDKALEYYFLGSIKKFVGNFAKKENIKQFYRKQVIKLHPDIYSQDDVVSRKTKAKIIELATERLKILNEYYRSSLY